MNENPNVLEAKFRLTHLIEQRSVLQASIDEINAALREFQDMCIKALASEPQTKQQEPPIISLDVTPEVPPVKARNIVKTVNGRYTATYMVSTIMKAGMSLNDLVTAITDRGWTVPGESALYQALFTQGWKAEHHSKGYPRKYQRR